MINELDAYRAANFDWTRQLKSIWRDPDYHIPGLHQKIVNDLVGYFFQRTAHLDPDDEPLGRVIVGPKGFGKTHLIGELRRQVWERNGWFVLLDFIGVEDFWSSVALGFLNSLQVRMADGKTQYDRVVLSIAGLLRIDQELASIARRSYGAPRELALELVHLFTRSLVRKYPGEANKYLDVLTALVLLISEDLDCHSIAHGWLQGMSFDGEDVRSLGFREENSPIKVVRGLSWIMSRTAPTLIAVDQIDAIVTASNSRANVASDDEIREQKKAQSIVDALAQGLMDLHECKHRAVTVISCLEATWKVLEDTTSVPMADRYRPPLPLQPLSAIETARDLISARLEPVYAARGFEPQFATWPFTDSAFQSAVGLSPRELLKACDRHQQQCIAAGKVTLCNSFELTEAIPTESESKPQNDLDLICKKEIEVAVIDGLLETEGEDKFRELIDRTLRLLEKHYELPSDIDSEVQRDPDQKRPSLHGRLSFTFLSEGSREQHYCFRLIGHTNARAFQTRLKAAMTASGIDTALRFRHLFILRRGDPPSGPKTSSLVDQFLKAGGKFVAPAEEDLRTFVGLAAVDSRGIPAFDTWLRRRQPLFKTRLFQEAELCPPLFLTRNHSAPTLSGKLGSASAGMQAPASASAEKSMLARPSLADSIPRLIPIGHRDERGSLGELVTLSAELLRRHVAVLAGPGSGKTVLIRRVIEEAALLGIASVVLDPNNDLSRLGDSWPAPPESWASEDVAKSEQYLSRADIVIWTPGVTSGNPISLNLLPDFAAIDDTDEREQAVSMAWSTMIAFLPGGSEKASRKKGILADAIRHFAAEKGSAMTDLIALLAELPDGISEDSNAQKLSSEIADQLRAAIAVNPLLRSAAQPLDPRILFEAPSGKTRISVINLSGLASEEARDSFVNRLQMSLFTFIKRSPSPTGRLYVVDEAQNFVPSGSGTACKASALSLVAQARKYGLGMIFATQTPKGIDNKIVSNCTTHLYGRMSAPATIDAIRELMAAKGGAADDIGKLSRGEFYFSTEGSPRPIKVRTPLCLSWHPSNPPTADEVIQKARSRVCD
jgi:hypothetical protein